MVIVAAHPGPGVAHQLHMSVPHTVPFSSQSVSMTQSSACARDGMLHEMVIAAHRTKDTMRTTELRFTAVISIVHERPYENPGPTNWRSCYFTIVAMADREGLRAQTGPIRVAQLDCRPGMSAADGCGPACSRLRMRSASMRGAFVVRMKSSKTAAKRSGSSR